jgi:hypothetical protein
MWSEIAEFLLALPVAALLLYLVPRRAARAWAGWLLVCLMAVSLQGIAQGVYRHYVPDRLRLFTGENELEFQKDRDGEITSILVKNPPEGCRGSRAPFQHLTISGGSLLLAFAALLLLLRAEPKGPAPATAAIIPSSWRRTGFSIQGFGVCVLLASMAEVIAGGSKTVNMLGVVVIASGFYVARGSRLAGKWAAGLSAMMGLLCLVLVGVIATGSNVNVFGKEIQREEAHWAMAIGLVAAAWAAANLYLVGRILSRPDTAG